MIKVNTCNSYDNGYIIIITTKGSANVDYNEETVNQHYD